MTRKRGAETSPPIGGLRKYNDFMEDKKTAWGGTREGAGRKARAKGRTYTFVSTPEVDALLSSYEGNKTELMNSAVLHYFHEHLIEHLTGKL